MASQNVEDIVGAYRNVNKDLAKVRVEYAQLEAALDNYRSVMEAKGIEGGATYSTLLKNFKKQGEYLSTLQDAQQKYASLLKKFTGPQGKIARYNINRNVKAVAKEENSKLVRIMRMPAIISLCLGIFLLAFSQSNLTGFAIGSRFVEVTTTFVLGFIFLLLGAILLLLVLRKQRNIYSLAAQEKPAKKKSSKKAKKTKKKAVKNKAKKRK